MYTAVFAPLIYAIFGTSKHLAFGPDAVTALILGSSVHEIVLRQTTGAESTLDAVPALPTPEVVMTYTTVVSFTVGLTLFLFGVFRLGFLDNVLSRSVVGGLIVAVATTILVSQFPTLFGFPRCVSKICPETSLWKFVDWVQGIQEGRTHFTTLTIGVITLICMKLLYALKDRLKNHTGLRHLPVILIVISSSVFASWFFDLPSMGVKTLGKVTVGLVRPSLPPDPFVVFQVSVRPALAVAAIIFIKSIVVAKEHAAQFHYAVSPNQELRAMGLANMIAAALGAFTASGSLARTKVAVSAGSRTPMTLIFASLIALMAVFLLMPLLKYLPSVTLAAVITHTVGGLIAPHASALIGMWRVGAFTDIVLFGGMVVISFITDIETGLVFGFGACLLLLIRQTSQASAQLLGFVPPHDLVKRVQATVGASEHGGHGDDTDRNQITVSPWQDVAIDDVLGSPDALLIPGVLMFKFFGALHFGNCEAIKNFVNRTTEVACGISVPQSIYGSTSAMRLQRELRAASAKLASKFPSTQEEASNNSLVNMALAGLDAGEHHHGANEPTQHAPTPLRAVILDLCQVPATDSSAIEMLHELIDHWEETGAQVLLVLHDISPPASFSGLTPSLRRVPSSPAHYPNSPSARRKSATHDRDTHEHGDTFSVIDTLFLLAKRFTGFSPSTSDTASTRVTTDVEKQANSQARNPDEITHFGGVDASSIHSDWVDEAASSTSAAPNATLDDLCKNILASDSQIASKPLSPTPAPTLDEDTTDAESSDERGAHISLLGTSATTPMGTKFAGLRRANSAGNASQTALEEGRAPSSTRSPTASSAEEKAAKEPPSPTLSPQYDPVAAQSGALQQLKRLLTRAAPFGTLHNLVFLSGLADKLSLGHGALFLSIQAALAALHERGILPSPVSLLTGQPDLAGVQTTVHSSLYQSGNLAVPSYQRGSDAHSPTALDTILTSAGSHKGMNPFSAQSTLAAAFATSPTTSTPTSSVFDLLAPASLGTEDTATEDL